MLEKVNHPGCSATVRIVADSASGLQDTCRRENVPESIRRLYERLAYLESELQHRAGSNPESLSTTVVATPALSSIGQATHANTNHGQPTNPSPLSVAPSPRGAAFTTTPISTLLNPTPVTSPDAASDAAQILEFLAWGRRKDQVFHDAPENASGPRRHSIDPNDTPPSSDLFSASVKNPQIELLEMLLPSKRHIRQLVEFHDRSLVWYHGSYNAVTFAGELDKFFSEYHGSLRHPEVNFQWVALLFAILTGSITCSTAQTAASWGFRDSERAKLSKQWYNATIVCLNLADYLEVHTVYSVQAICSLTISAHIIGVSNTQSVLLSSANRIAQSLGIHRLGSEPTGPRNPSSDDVAQRNTRETGRRLWCQLCTQDWFSIPFSESYALNPDYIDTAKPLNKQDDGFDALPAETPTVTSYCNYLYDIAALIPQVQDAMTHSNTLYTKYEQVLSYDEKMRQLATSYLPTFLSSSSPIPESWPVYVPWARRSLAVCAAHKIIMIHRKFLGPSFTNSAFGFTRKTCIAASKTILKGVKAAVDESGPVLWIDQAFTVAAGIILLLDSYHRSTSEPEFAEHRKLAEEGIEYLKRFPLSMIATRGIRLLNMLFSEPTEQQTSNRHNSRKRRNESNAERPDKRARSFNVPDFARNISAMTPDLDHFGDATTSGQVDWDSFADLFPPLTDFGGDHLFSNFF
jgi:hypothetical protein